MPVKVDGRGFMVRGEAVREVQILAGGTIQSMEVKTGDVIETGTVVARLVMRTSRPGCSRRGRCWSASSSSRPSSSGARRRHRSRAGCASPSPPLRPISAQEQKLVDRGLLTSASVAALDQQITSLQNSMAQSMIGTGDRGLRVEDKRLESRARNQAGDRRHRAFAVFRPGGRSARYRAVRKARRRSAV